MKIVIKMERAAEHPKMIPSFWVYRQSAKTKEKLESPHRYTQTPKLLVGEAKEREDSFERERNGILYYEKLI